MLLWWLFNPVLMAQDLRYQPTGIKPIYSFNSKQYKANPQNFEVTQDNRGIMYFANAGGVLEYDGETWNVIPVSTQQVFSIETSKKGTVYAGCLNNFGKLGTTKNGTIGYISLSDKLLKEKTPTISSITCVDQWIYFFPDRNLTSNFLYGYNEQENKVYKIVTPFKIQAEWQVNNRSLLQLENGDLYEIKNRELKLLTQTTSWGELPIYNIFERNDSVFIYSNGKIFVSTHDLKKTPVEDSRFQLATGIKNFLVRKNQLIYFNKEGIYICNPFGKIQFPITKIHGLIDNNVREIMLDKDNNLWAATENGISVIDVYNTLTFFGYDEGVDGAVHFVNSFKNEIYAETRSGLFRLNRSIPYNEKQQFTIPFKLSSSPYGITTFVNGTDSLMILADFDGILKRNSNGDLERILSCAPWNVAACEHHRNWILVPDYTSGLIILEYANNRFTPVYIDELKNISGRYVFEDHQGVFWLSDEINGIYKITPSPDGKTFSVQKYDQKQNLPEGFSFAFHYNNQLYFATEKGFYELSGNKFISSNLLKLDFTKSYTIHRASPDTDGNLWVSAYDSYDIKKFFTGYGKIVNNKMQWIFKPFVKVNEEKVDIFYHQNQFVTWMGGPDGLYRFDKRDALTRNKNFSLLFRKFIWHEDSVLYGGIGNYNPENWVFAYDKNKYRFEFASTQYNTANGIKYSYFLEGYDKNWSKYTEANFIEYSNLLEGDYIIRVKAIDEFGNISKEFTLKFEITPPFYRTTLAYILYCVGFILIIIGAVRISSNGLKKIIKQRTREIEEQKHIVEEKNKEILDSINYAKRLQTAILPSEKTIVDLLKDNFILYKPKDIIAGDFYWLETVGDLVLFAACDCTGHGVPGAMVSVVGANSLNRCVKEFHLTQPAKILDQLTLLVEETFSHSEKEVRDGMDVSLCVLNTKTLELQWAGANNPLWLVRNGELIEYKGDKQPIGKFELRKPFTNHIIQLQKNDSIYMLTDGYPDQFGGEKGKKFKYSNLKDLILTNVGNSMHAQLLRYDEVFEEWRHHYEQTDDVCLWGVRI